MRSLTEPVRVCFLIDELATAGTETQLLALLHHLDRSRVSPYLVLLRGESDASVALEPADCPVLRLGAGALRSPKTALRALRFMQFLWRERIEVVQVYFPDSSYFGVPAAFLAGVRHRLRTRNNVGHWMTRLHRILGRALNSLTTATVANCEAAKRALLADEKPAADRVHVLENGVDLDRFLSIPEPSDTPLRWVGAVANLRPVKGLDVLVEAAALLREEFPEVGFRVAGEGDERGRLTQLIHERHLDGRFYLDGAENDVPGFLSKLDIAVLPSRAEGMSNAVLEYMAAARPIVASAVGAMPDVLHDETHGLLVAPGDPVALADQIARLLRDPPLARRLGAAARQRANEHFSRPAMVRRFEEFYTRLVSRA